eukprot:4986232-Amphidinium_carterae.1
MGDMAEHSLYASALYIAGLPVNAHDVQTLHDEIANIMQHALEHNQLIAGQTMEAWARDLHYSVNDLISMTNNEPTRDGNMLDGYLASLVLGTRLGCSIWMYPPEGQAYMQSHSPTPNYSIACNGRRYVVIVTPPATADQRAHFTYMHDTWSDLPLTLLRSPRAEAMESALHLNIRESLDGRYIAKVFHHAHFPAHHVHIRYALLILSPDTMPTYDVPDQTYPMSMNNLTAVRELPSWTAFARVAVELDVATEYIAVELMDQVYQRTHDILFHRLEDLLQNLLGPHAEQLDALYDSCVQLIDNTMSEYPAI